MALPFPRGATTKCECECECECECRSEGEGKYAKRLHEGEDCVRMHNSRK